MTKVSKRWYDKGGRVGHTKADIYLSRRAAYYMRRLKERRLSLLTATIAALLTPVFLLTPVPVGSPESPLSISDVSTPVELYSTVTHISSEGEETTYTTKAYLSQSPQCTNKTQQVRKAEKTLSRMKKKLSNLRKNNGTTPALTQVKNSVQKQQRKVNALKRERQELCTANVLDPVTPPNSSTPEAPSGTPTGSYAYLVVDQNNNPAHWDKCSPIRYRINPNGITESGISDINTAIRMLSEASGMVFQYVGTTDVVPYNTEDWYQPLVGKNKDTELYISFSTESVVPDLAGTTVGLGGSLWKQSTERKAREPEIILGGLVLDSEAAIEPGFGVGYKRGSVILHELGHVMNLAHVDEIAELMYPSVTDFTKGEYGDGDKSGLQKMLEYPCFN